MLPVKRDKHGGAKSALRRALERFRTEREERASASASIADSAPPAAVAQERDEFFIVQRCAVTGRYSRILFERAPSGMYIPKSRAIKVENAQTDSVRSQAAAQSIAVQVNEIGQFPDEPCPWCGAKCVHVHVRCGSCQELVCTGRSYTDEHGVMFVCHEDCGGCGYCGGQLTSYEATPTGSDRPKHRALTHDPHKAVASETRLLLRGQGKR